MNMKKLVRLTDEQSKKLEILVEQLGISENDVFRVAITKLYKEFIEQDF